MKNLDETTLGSIAGGRLSDLIPGGPVNDPPQTDQKPTSGTNTGGGASEDPTGDRAIDDAIQDFHP